MENYFELELSPNEFYYGQLNEEEGQMEGLGLYVNKSKHIYIGEFQKSKMHGTGALLDLEECSLYLGQLHNSEKSGFGHIVKYRGSSDLRPLMDGAYNCDKESFPTLVSNWV